MVVTGSFENFVGRDSSKAETLQRHANHRAAPTRNTEPRNAGSGPGASHRRMCEPTLVGSFFEVIPAGVLPACSGILGWFGVGLRKSRSGAVRRNALNSGPGGRCQEASVRCTRLDKKGKTGGRGHVAALCRRGHWVPFLYPRRLRRGWWRGRLVIPTERRRHGKYRKRGRTPYRSI